MPWAEIATFAGCVYVTVGMMAVIQAVGTGAAKRWGVGAPARLLVLFLFGAPLTLMIFVRIQQLRSRYPMATTAEIEAIMSGELEED
jgi:hypothetical protein